MNSQAEADKDHNAPCSNRDYDFFYAGLERNVLLAQSCSSCGTLRNPPLPSCPSCLSLEWAPRQLSGRGTIYSYIVHHYPPLDGFASPHPVAVVTLDEGVRFTGALDGTAPQEVAIGLPVEAEFVRRGDFASFRFKLADRKD